MALACAQNGLHLSLEGIQLLQRHKGLHGAGKAAAKAIDEYIQSKGKGGKAAPATAEESETK